MRLRHILAYSNAWNGYNRKRSQPDSRFRQKPDAGRHTALLHSSGYLRSNAPPRAGPQVRIQTPPDQFYSLFYVAATLPRASIQNFFVYYTILFASLTIAMYSGPASCPRQSIYVWVPVKQKGALSRPRDLQFRPACYINLCPNSWHSH